MIVLEIEILWNRCFLIFKPWNIPLLPLMTIFKPLGVENTPRGGLKIVFLEHHGKSISFVPSMFFGVLDHLRASVFTQNPSQGVKSGCGGVNPRCNGVNWKSCDEQVVFRWRPTFHDFSLLYCDLWSNSQPWALRKLPSNEYFTP